MSTGTFQPSARPTPPSLVLPATRPVLDVLVLNAATLIEAHRRAGTIERILDITQRSTRSLLELRGLWLLVMTHTSLEREQAYQLTLALSTRCQGIRAVKEQNRVLTERAALAFHRLHFPAVPHQERPSRILVFGSSRMEALFPCTAGTKIGCLSAQSYP